MTKQQPIIMADQVELLFGEDTGVHNLSMIVEPGTIFGLIGPSGSGKTTSVRLLTGVHRPSRGSLRVLGETPSKFSTRARERIGYMPQLFTLYPNLTVLENLNFVASLYGMGYFSRHRPIRSILDFVELSDARHRLGRNLSGGMQRRLLLACALVHEPTLLFADEPTAGIDPVLRGKFWDYFRELRDSGRTLVVTTQYVGEAAYCDLVGVMQDGRLIRVDTPQGLRRAALGGEVLRLILEPQQTLVAAQILQQHRAVSDVRRSRREPGLLFIYVERAAEALPAVVTELNEHPEISIKSIEEYQPPFDDVFVRLMEQSSNNHV